MSKLRDRIRRLGRREGTTMGFAQTKAVTAPQLLLLALVEDGAAAPPQGADGVILAAGAKPGSGEGLWGIVSGGGSLPPEAATADFIVARADTAIDALDRDDRGIVIAVDETWSDGVVRALEMLSPDALYVTLEGQPSLGRLLALRRLNSLAAPLLVETSVELDGATLALLRDAGVAGIVVAGAAHAAAGRLRERIDALPPRRRRNEERQDAMLPVASMGRDDDDEHDHDH